METTFGRYRKGKKMEDYSTQVELIGRSKTPEQAFQRFAAFMEYNGYDRVAYSLVTDHPSLNLPKQHGLATSYPEDWMKHYQAYGYMDIDPVTAAIKASKRPFFWADLTADPTLAANSLQLMNEAADAGIRDGIGISLSGHAGEIVGVGLARSCPGKITDREFLPKAYLLSVIFHDTYRGLLAERITVTLTSRECEILSWAAEGKTDDEIATILHLRFNTVRFHWKNIFNKLEAHSRTYAVIKAIRMGLITPATIGNCTMYNTA